MKKVIFNEDLGCLVNSLGVKYEGKRFSKASGNSTKGSCYQEFARNHAVKLLEESAEKKGADAYEIICSTVSDSMQEYDSTPWTATVTAILYKTG